jgi:hypothetical protein
MPSSRKLNPDRATRSLTVLETSTSPGAASDAIRADVHHDPTQWYSDNVFGSYIDQIFAHNRPFPMLQTDSSCGCQDRGDANEVGRREDEKPFSQVARPRCLVLRRAPTVLSQPNGPSICFRLIILMVADLHVTLGNIQTTI